MNRAGRGVSVRMRMPVFSWACGSNCAVHVQVPRFADCECVPDMHFVPRPQHAEPNTPQKNDAPVIGWAARRMEFHGLHWLHGPHGLFMCVVYWS